VHVSFVDGTKANAKVLAEDKLLDLAVIKVGVPASVLKPLPIGSSDSLRLGDSVMAIGNPFGLDRSVSVGVVSGVHRQIQAPNGFTLSNAVQTDAAINHGNSGGPLIDWNGRVVGVNAQIAESGVDANVGVGFSIAIDTAVKRAIASMEQGKAVQHPWLGVSLDEVDAILGTSGRVKASTGVLLTGIVPGSPAAQAGLRGGSSIAQVDGAQYCVGGDIVTAVGGVRVTTSGELQTAVSNHGPGATVQFSVVRANGQKANIPVTLGTQPTTPPNTTTGCN
jgi:S1-C subfamily serine protease